MRGDGRQAEVSSDEQKKAAREWMEAFGSAVLSDVRESFMAQLATLLAQREAAARLSEAKWWRNYFPENAKQYDERIATLTREAQP